MTRIEYVQTLKYFSRTLSKIKVEIRRHSKEHDELRSRIREVQIQFWKEYFHNDLSIENTHVRHQLESACLPTNTAQLFDRYLLEFFRRRKVLHQSYSENIRTFGSDEKLNNRIELLKQECERSEKTKLVLDFQLKTISNPIAELLEFNAECQHSGLPLITSTHNPYARSHRFFNWILNDENPFPKKTVSKAGSIIKKILDNHVDYAQQLILYEKKSSELKAFSSDLDQKNKDLNTMRDMQLDRILYHERDKGICDAYSLSQDLLAIELVDSGKNMDCCQIFESTALEEKFFAFKKLNTLSNLLNKLSSSYQMLFDAVSDGCDAINSAANTLTQTTLTTSPVTDINDPITIALNQIAQNYTHYATVLGKLNFGFDELLCRVDQDEQRSILDYENAVIEELLSPGNRGSSPDDDEHRAIKRNLLKSDDHSNAATTRIVAPVMSQQHAGIITIDSATMILHLNRVCLFDMLKINRTDPPTIVQHRPK